jgi:aspartate racemase
MIELSWPSGAAMKKIGIVGGVAWASTVEYYTEICRLAEERHIASGCGGAPATPEMTIESLDHRKAVSYLGNGSDEESWRRFDDYHRAALLRLETAGADFALMASNTPHDRFESILRGVGIPVLDLFKVVAAEAARVGAERVLILGTALTMSSQRFRCAFSKHGINAAGPDDETLRMQTVQLTRDLQIGYASDAAERLSAIAKICAQGEHGPQPLVCLACTELPLAFAQHKLRPYFELDGLVYLNTTIVHARAAFERAVE